MVLDRLIIYLPFLHYIMFIPLLQDYLILNSHTIQVYMPLLYFQSIHLTEEPYFMFQSMHLTKEPEIMAVFLGSKTGFLYF